MTSVIEVTGDVATVNVAVVAPAATSTAGGRLAAGELLASPTDAPPEGAAEISVTTPCVAAPPTIDDGVNTTLESAALTVGVVDDRQDASRNTAGPRSSTSRPSAMHGLIE